MAQEVKLTPAGLYTNPGDLSRPDGALDVADNVVIRREGVIEPRRGVSAYATHAANKLKPYNVGFVSHSSTTTISYDTGSGSFTANSGSYAATSDGVSFAEAGGNLYFTTSLGVYRKDTLASTPLLSGVPKAVGFERDQRVATSPPANMSLTSNIVSVTTSAAHGFYVGQVVTQTSATEAPYAAGNYTVLTIPTTTSFTYSLVAANDAANANTHTFAPAEVATVAGFLADGFQVAYRYVLDAPDTNHAQNLGAASPRRVVANASGTRGWVTTEAKNVIVRARLPSGVVAGTKIRLYRSKQVATTVEPSEEMGLVWEAVIKASEITNGFVDVSDIVTDALRGETIYIAPSQEGILANNDRPPQALDVMQFQNRLIYGYTTELSRFVITVLGVGGTTGIQNGDVLVATDSYTFTTSTPTTASQVYLETGGTAAQNIRNTALNLCAAVNRTSSTVYAFYVSGADDLPGQILIEARTISDNAGITASGMRTAYFPTLGTPSKTVNLSRTASTVTATAVSGSIYFFVGESVNLSNGDANFPNGFKTITATTSTTFTYTEAGAATTLSGAIFGLATSSIPGPVSQTSEATIAESKIGQPDAVPLVNFQEICTGRLLKLASLRDVAFAFTDIGLFRGVDNGGQTMEWTQFDSTVILISRASVASVGNQLYAWTTQGVVAITETGVEIVSRPIEKTLLELYGAAPAEVASLSFGIGYDSERNYRLHTVSSAGETSATQAFIFNFLTRTWVRDTFVSKHGVVNPANDRLYLAGTTSVLKERKDYAFTDYSDEDAAVTISSKDASAGTITLSGDPGGVTGNILVQGSVYARITSNSTVTLTIAAEDIYLIASFSVAAATLKKKISSAVTWAPISAGSPATLKLFREVGLLFGNAMLPVASTFYGTELIGSSGDPTPQNASIAFTALPSVQWDDALAPDAWNGVDEPMNVRLPVPQEARRGARFVFKFTAGTAWSVWSLNGLSITYEGGSERVVK